GEEVPLQALLGQGDRDGRGHDIDPVSGAGAPRPGVPRSAGMLEDSGVTSARRWAPARRLRASKRQSVAMSPPMKKTVSRPPICMTRIAASVYVPASGL